MNNVYKIPCPEAFNLSLCLDCGQAFRWMEKDNIWQGVAYGKHLKVEQTKNEIIFYDCTEDDFNNIWSKYFDLQCDYKKITSSYDDKYLQLAVNEYNGIRILRQEPWEALCSFIISQNNNIPRIKGIIERLCDEFGDGEKGRKTFPSAETLSELTVEDLAPLRAGFRAKYIIDANEIIPLLERLVDCIEEEANVQLFITRANVLTMNLDNLITKYDGLPESYYESFRKLVEINQFVKTVAQLRREAVTYQRYLAYQATGSIYNPNNINQQLEYLLEELNSAVILLKQEG